MAHTCPIAELDIDYTGNTLQRRRELFPSNDDDSDELGHISPLSDSTPSNSPTCSSPSAENILNEHNLTNFNKSTIADYIILENICDSDKRNIPKSVETIEENMPENKTPLSNRHCYGSNDKSMSPLHFSPLQVTLHTDLASSPNNFKHKAVNNDLRKSPSFNQKTPQSTSVINSEVPKLIRKSPLESCCSNLEPGKRKMPFCDTPSTNKHPKWDHSSRVRTVLFPKSETAVPTTSFYSKCTTSHFGLHVLKNISLDTRKVKQKTSRNLYAKKGNKKRYGQINAGVKHKIRKPKQKKITEAQLLKAALNIIDNSPLSGYLNDSFSMRNSAEIQLQKNNTVSNQPSPSTSVAQDANSQTDDNESEMSRALDVEITESKKRELSPSPNPNKKFFKFSRSSATVTVDKHLKLKVDNGKLSILDSKKPKRKCATHTRSELNLDADDLIVPDNENLIPSKQIDDILFNLGGSNNKENNENLEQITNMTKKVSEYTQQLTLKAHNSVAMSENAIHLHAFEENQQCKNSRLSLNCSLVPKHTNEKSVLLSPTSQMCNMTSGLALSSPKKAKQNITNILNNKNFGYVDSFNNISSPADMEQGKVFPIFTGMNKMPSKSLKATKAVHISKKPKPLPKNQMLLDAGQKKFGATQCSECKFVYHMGDPNDELIHLNYHEASNILRFNGWKDEHVVAKFSNARIIRVLPSDPKPWLRKIKDLLEVVNRDLGYYEMQANLNSCQVYLYIKQKAIVGCLVAESKNTAYRMLTENVGIDLCSEKGYPIKCGISRIWVSQTYRKEGIGTSLLNSLRGNFIYGTILAKDDIAFSSPTEDGKAFAAKYFNTPNFLIYA